MTQSTNLYSATNSVFSTASTTLYGAFNSEGAARAAEVTSEAPVQAKWRCGAATIKNMYAYCPTMGRTTDTTVNCRIAGANTAVVITLTASGGAGVYSDTTHTVSIADGDTFDYTLVTGTGSGSVILSLNAEVEFASTSKAPITNYGAVLSVTSSGFCVVGGGVLIRSAEATVECQALEACVLSNIQLYVSTNVSAAGMDWKLRKNAADPAGQPKIAAATIGTNTNSFFEDTTNTLSLASGDTYCYACSAPSAAIGLRLASCTYSSNSGTPIQAVASNLASDGTAAAGATTYSTFGVNNTGSTETQWQLYAPMAYTISMFSARVYTNALASGTATGRVRKNAADGNENISFAVGETGVHQDTTNSDVLALGDKLSLKFVGGTGGAARFSWVGALMAGVTSVASASGAMMMTGAG